MAILLSASVKNFAVLGESGSTSKDTIPQAILMDPKIRKTYIHFGNPVVMCPTA